MSKNHNPLKNIFISCLGISILIIIAIIFYFRSEPIKELKNRNEDEVQKRDNEKIYIEENVKTLGFTVKELQMRINKNLQENDITSFKIFDNINEKNTSNATNEFKLNDHILIHSLINNENEEIKSSQFVILGENISKADMENTILAISIFIGSIDPSLTEADRVSILSELGLLSKEVDLLDHKSIFSKNNIEYNYFSTNKEGIWLAASVVN